MSRGVDLSPEAIALRRDAAARGHDGGMTGGELAASGIAHAQQAMKLRKRAAKKANAKRAKQLRADAEKALLTAAAQLMLAERTPANRPYLHVLSARDVQRVIDGVRSQASADLGTLAVDVHRRAIEAAARLGQEAPPE